MGSAVEIAYATHAWTPDGKEASVTDADGNKTAYAYDGFDRLAQTTYPAVTLPGQVDVLDFESFAYDANGNAVSHRLRGGGSVTSVFDALNRMTGRTVPAYGGQAAAVTTTTAYDLAGRETAVSDTLGNVIASAYDAAGRRASTTQTIPGLTGTKTVSYQYDAASNRTRLTWPDGYYVGYTFDALNRMSSAAENGATTLATYSYDPLSRRTGLAYGNGTTVAAAYSAAGDLTSLVHDLLGTADDATTTLTYTPAHQLGRESVSNPAWDRSPPTAATVAYVPNGLNQYTTVGGASFVHDAQGNLTSDGARTFAYDAENRLLTATVAGTTTTYAYDPRGRRTAKLTPTVGGPRWGTAIWGAFPWTAALAGPGTTFFLDSGDDEIAELDPSGTVTRRYVPGPAIDEPIAMVTAATGAREYLHANHQGSIVATSDDTGALAEGPLTYDAYGACYAGATNTPCAASGIPYRFTGRRYDPETGLYYYRARYYDPTIGRFLQTDPVGYGDDLDWYTYVGNDPANLMDAMGTGPIGWIVKLTEKGMVLIEPLFEKSAAVAARRAEKNVLSAKGRQAAGQIETGSAEDANDVVRHAGHDLGDGAKGSPHFQTEGRRGHTFYDAGTIISGVIVVLDILDQLDPWHIQEMGGNCDIDGCAGHPPLLERTTSPLNSRLKSKDPLSQGRGENGLFNEDTKPHTCTGSLLGRVDKGILIEVLM